MPNPPHAAAGRRCAYAFYATDDAYAVAALVFAQRLRELGVRADAELVVLHHSVSRRLVKAMGALGLEARRVAPIKGRRGYFRDSLTKLRVFELTGYDRLVFADVDAIPLRPLDPLFDLPLSGPLAAPNAYWHPQPWWTSALMVIEPSAAIPSRLAAPVETARRDRFYDMDIVNHGFSGEIDTLADETFCLNSEWEDSDRPGHFPDPDEGRATVSPVALHGSGQAVGPHSGRRSPTATAGASQPSIASSRNGDEPGTRCSTWPGCASCRGLGA